MHDHWAILATGLSFLFSVEAVAQVPADRRPDPPAPNILVIVADDVGVDVLHVYGEGYEKACNSYWLPLMTECSTSANCPPGQTCVPNYPPTPTIDSLAANGILFRNAWSCPTCSPTRATIQTGRYGFRTGVFFASVSGLGDLFGGENDLPDWEITIPEALTLAGSPYATAAIGKWHLGGGNTGPNDQGYSYFAGTMEFFDCFTNQYNFYYWPRIVNGVETTCYNYATTQNVDDALAWLSQQTSPWFLYLAFNAAHAPYHAPPDELHSYHGDVRPNLPWDRIFYGPSNSHNCLCAFETRDYRYCYQADVEAMDHEMRRLLDGLGPNWPSDTTIVFVGDNGTSGRPVFGVTAPPFDPTHGKATMYEGGINVPLIISGARVQNPNRESGALVNTTDLFATVLNLAGVDPSAVITDRPLDSVSLMPIIEDSTPGSLRDYVYSESYFKLVFPVLSDYEHAIRNIAGYKLIHRPYNVLNLVDRYALFYLPDDPFEHNDLYNDLLPNLTPEQQANFDDLKAQMESLVTAVSPPDGESCQPTSGTLEWPLDLQAVGYRVQIGTEYGTGPEVDVTSSHYDYSGLQRDTTYYWRVKSRDEHGEYGTYSRCYSFITVPEPLPPPTLLIPANGATGQRSRGTLDWSDVPGALGYRVQLGTACGTGSQSDVTASECPYSRLVPGATYYWRVKTKDLCDQYGDYSACFSFVVGPEPDINCEDLTGHDFHWAESNHCSPEYAWQIVNEGNAVLQGHVSLLGPDCSHFRITLPLPPGTFSLTPGQSQTVKVQFCPTSVGHKECALHITSNDPDESPCDVPMTGDCGTNLWGDGSDGNRTITVDTTLTRDMNYRNLTVLSGKLNTHGYTVRVLETLTNGGTMTDDWSGGQGGDGGAAGKGANYYGGGSDPTGCGRLGQYCSEGEGAVGAAGQPGLVRGAGAGGRGGGGGGGGGGGWWYVWPYQPRDADGGNGGAGGAGGKGGGYVKVYAHTLDNQGEIHADGHDGEDGWDAPRGDEGVMHDPDDPYGYWHCGAEYYEWTYLGMQRTLAGGGGGGGGGGTGGNGGTVDLCYSELVGGGMGIISNQGGAGGAGGAGGSSGGNCPHPGLVGQCSDGCDGGAGSAGYEGHGGRGGHACNDGGNGMCAPPGEPGDGGHLGRLGDDGPTPDPNQVPDCSSDADCDDGLYCNGVEHCVNGHCVPGTPPNCDDGLEAIPKPDICGIRIMLHADIHG